MMFINFKESFKQVFYPANSIVMISNIIIYITLQNIFFWFKVSRSVENLIDEKSILFKDLAKNDDIKNLYSVLLSDTNKIEHILEKASIDREERYEHNIELIFKWNSPIFCILFSFIIIEACILFYKKSTYVKNEQNINSESVYKFNRIDYILLCMVCLAFLTEIIFYFAVLERSILIGDSEIIKSLLIIVDKDIIKDIIIKLIMSSYDSPNEFINEFFPAQRQFITP